MFKAIAAVLALWSATALADVDSEFPKKALGIEWSATLQQVQAAYPGGTVHPAQDDREVVYLVPGDFRVLDINLSVPLLQFVFTKENTLNRIFWHFKYADREDALYGVAQILGQDYSISDDARARFYRWKPGRTSAAVLQIGTGPEFPWAYLGVQSMGRGGDAGKR